MSRPSLRLMRAPRLLPRRARCRRRGVREPTLQLGLITPRGSPACRDAVRHGGALVAPAGQRGSVLRRGVSIAAFVAAALALVLADAFTRDS